MIALPTETFRTITTVKINPCDSAPDTARGLTWMSRRCTDCLAPAGEPCEIRPTDKGFTSFTGLPHPDAFSVAEDVCGWFRLVDTGEEIDLAHFIRTLD